MARNATQKVRPGDGRTVRRAEELGIDLGLIDENLSLTPLERMRQHDENVRQIIAARKRLGISGSDET